MSAGILLKNQWVWWVTTLQGVGITSLNRIAANVGAVFTLNAPAVWTADVPSDNPDVDVISGLDGDPLVSYNNRLIYGFRREGDYPPYVCRFGGILQIIQDEATVDQPVSHLQAFDPWQWLNTLPLIDSRGNLVGAKGLSYANTPGSTIALDLLDNTMAALVSAEPMQPLFIDSASGTVEVTEFISIKFDQGMTLGEAWTKLTDTGTMDIVLDPVYDPYTRPGVLSVLSIYNEAGQARNDAVFSWDKFPRSLVGVNRLNDGTQMANTAQFFVEGIPVTQALDSASRTEYGAYWSQRAYPGPPTPFNRIAVSLLAQAQVALRKKGRRTITIDPAPERSPDPFTEYGLGDRVPVYAGRPLEGNGSSFRAVLNPGEPAGDEWSNPQRVYAIPISLDADQVETVTQLLLTDPNE